MIMDGSLQVAEDIADVQGSAGHASEALGSLLCGFFGVFCSVLVP
jgi:hypothetical protein